MYPRFGLVFEAEDAVKTMLTDRFIASVKPQSGDRMEVHDAGCAGLSIRITARGVRTWVLRYRAPDGRHARHTIGSYPTFGLKDARSEAGRLRAMIHHGGDPEQERREARLAARLNAMDTFGRLMEGYWGACERGEWQPKRKVKRPETLVFEKRLAARHIEPVLSHLPVSNVTRLVVKDLLRGMIAQGIGAQTNRVQAIIRQVFNYAIGEDLVQINPAMGFPAFFSSRPRRRIWKDPVLRRLWTALESDELRTPDGAAVNVGRPVRIAIQLAILLLQRRKEIAGMDLAELDLEQATWLIGPERMKGGRPHQVPLPPYAIELIHEALSLSKLPTDRTHGPVFPSPGDLTVPINAEALTRAMDRLRDVLDVEDLTVHDLRRTGSTILTSERLKVSPLIRSKVLGHETDSGGGALVSSVHYDVNEYMSEKRAALRAWETLLLRIVRQDKPVSRLRPGVHRTAMFGLEIANDMEPIATPALRG